MASADARAVFDALYSEHRHAVHAYVLARTADREVAQDLVQDVFLRAWRSIASWQALAPERRRAWLFTATRNLVIDHLRASATRARTSERLALQARLAPQASESPEVGLAASEQMRQLDAAIWRLPEALRAPLLLQLVGRCSSVGIGELLGQPPGTVRFHLAQARERLAAELSGAADDDER